MIGRALTPIRKYLTAQNACSSPRIFGLGLTAACLVALTLTACGRSPVIRYYTLRPVAEAGSGEVSPGTLAVAVGPARMPRYLERPEIVWRAGPNRLEYDSVDRWADSLESSLLSVLGRNLAVLLATNRIVVYPGDAPFPLDYRVVLDVQQLDGERAADALLRVRWTISSGNGNPPLAIEVSEIRKSGSLETTDDLVEAYSEAIAELAGQIATRLRSLENERESVPGTKPEPGPVSRSP